MHSLLADADVVREMKLGQQENDLPSPKPALKKLLPTQPCKVMLNGQSQSSCKGEAGNIAAVGMCVLLHS